MATAMVTRGATYLEEPFGDALLTETNMLNAHVTSLSSRLLLPLVNIALKNCRLTLSIPFSLWLLTTMKSHSLAATIKRFTLVSPLHFTILMEIIEMEEILYISKEIKFIYSDIDLFLPEARV